jgi:iron complex outermembrane receptor protein
VSQSLRGRIAAVIVTLALAPRAEAFEDIGALGRMSLEELSNLVVTSVSKSPEQLSEAPAAVFVITRAELLRSGATTLPDALRLAPNLQVAQTTANAYAVAPRGLAGNVALQNFPNKLLVLIDGRSVYSPLFSGIYWDAQDVMLDDVERIEVISGPGATLWGANAFNGVVNVITRSAADTAGAVASIGAGTIERAVQARWGAELAPGVAARIYAKGLERDALERPDGSDAEDDWRKAQVGFRVDARRDADAFTLQGDLQRAHLNQPGPLDLDVDGANVLGRWSRELSETAGLQVQVYVDDSERAEDAGGVGLRVRTYDLQAQHSFTLGESHRIVWGVGHRLNRYTVRGTDALSFVPAKRTLELTNVFAQDTIALRDDLKLTLGLKLEDDPYESWVAQPEVRLAWAPQENVLWWVSAARAIRAATPFDVDVVERVGGRGILRGDPTFRPERVQAFELGYRGRPLSRLQLSVAAFYNQYDALRSIELAPAPTSFPFQWGNGIEGDAHGVDAWADWQVTDRWRLSPGFRWLQKDLRFSPGASGIGGIDQAGLDPRRQATLASSLDLGPQVTFDVYVRHQGPIEEAGLDGYTDVDARLGWHVSSGFDVALVGRNLLARGHVESTVPGASEATRAGMLTARWSF